jgi:hypothetical protein
VFPDVHSIVPQRATEISVACEFRNKPESLRLRASHAVVPYVRVAPSYLVRPRCVGFGRVGPRGGGGTCGHCKRDRKSENGHGDADRQDSVCPGRWASSHRSLLSIVRNGGAVQHTDSLPGPRNPRVSVRSRGPYRGAHARRGRRRPRRHGRSWTLCSDWQSEGATLIAQVQAGLSPSPRASSCVTGSGCWRGPP